MHNLGSVGEEEEETQEGEANTRTTVAAMVAALAPNSTMPDEMATHRHEWPSSEVRQEGSGCSATVTPQIDITPKVRACLNSPSGELRVPFTLSVSVSSSTCNGRFVVSEEKRQLIYHAGPSLGSRPSIECLPP